MSTRDNAPIVVVGSINADTTYLVPHLPSPGETILGTNRLDAPGGKGANQAAAIAALGASVDFVGAVGADDLGSALVVGLEDRGVGVSHLSSETASPTGSAVILVADSGENSIVVHPGANALLTPGHVEEYLKEQSPKIALTQFEIPLETVEALCNQFSGILIVNPAPMPPQSAVRESIISRANILVPNRTELAALAGTSIPLTLADVVQCASGLSFSGDLVVTLGSEGALCFAADSPGEPVMVNSPVVNTVDTSGAGDAFCGALAVAIHEGRDLVSSVDFANGVASWSVTQTGAQIASRVPALARERS